MNEGVPSRRPAIVAAVGPADARARVADELTRRYSADYAVSVVGSNGEARTAMTHAVERGAQVALLLTDDPSSDSVDGSLFVEARELFPDVRRGLLIEWGSWADGAIADTILALMSRVQIDYYVVRPSHAPDEYFHRTVTDFLLDWERANGQRRRYFTVIGDDAQPRTHELRRRLARGGVPTGQLSPDSEEGAALLASAAVEYSGVPLVRTADGQILVNPDDAQLANAHGLTTSIPSGPVDVAIVGAGPAGLAAAVYASSEGLSTLVLERDSIGGQAGSSSLIRNYLGFPRGVSGSDLAQNAYQQAWAFGARFAHTREVVGLQRDEEGFRLTIAPGDEVHARSVIVASGVSYRRLNVGDLAPFVGASVFYGVSAVEAKAQAGRTVHVVGGGNSAGQAALHLARYAASVSLILRGSTLADSMSKYLIDQLDAAGVHLLTESKVVGGGGNPRHPGGRLDHIVLRNRVTGDETTVASEALFITIGAAPHTEWLDENVLRDRWGSVITGNEVITEGGRRAWPLDRPPAPHESSVPGLFAVGDVRRGSIKRVASGVGEGSVVVSAVHAFLAERAGLPVT